MKEKNVAGILALFLGGLGVHRFYLGQNGLGVFYLLFFWFPVIWLVGLIDAIAFFSMDQETFDRKYNREFYYYEEGKRVGSAYPEGERSNSRRRAESRRGHYKPSRGPAPQPAKRKARSPKKVENPYKTSGLEKFKDYDYSGAIEDFQKALEIERQDIATHFNIACAYSLDEQPDRAFYHLDRAVALGFDDFDRIREHDKLAYLRIQDEYEVFQRNGFRLAGGGEAPPAKAEGEEQVEDHSHLLEQLKKLGDLREKGLLTDEEFSIQKKRLLG